MSDSCSNMKVAAGFVIFRRLVGKNVEYLLLQASYGEHHWTPPKGHVDPGEDEMTTALRETKEEAGLDAKDFRILENAKKELFYNVRGKPKRVVYWLAELKDPNKEITLSEEHQDKKWLRLDEACKYAKYSDTIDLLNYCEEFIRKNE